MGAHEAERRIYTRPGFSPIGEILHISLPDMLEEKLESVVEEFGGSRRTQASPNTTDSLLTLK